jgi:hypothetical protein
MVCFSPYQMPGDWKKFQEKPQMKKFQWGMMMVECGG